MNENEHELWRQREIIDNGDWNRYKLNSIQQRLKNNDAETKFNNFFFKRNRRTNNE